MFNCTQKLATSTPAANLIASEWMPIVGVDFKEEKKSLGLMLLEAIADASAEELHEFLKEALHF
jgi:hypothetical protein